MQQKMSSPAASGIRRRSGKPRELTVEEEREQEREQLIAELRERLGEHLDSLGLGHAGTVLSKDAVRASHSAQRKELLAREHKSLVRHVPRLINRFADGREIDPASVEAELVPVEAESDSGLIFRLATTLWSVPVSRGYGRRMRFLVLDRANDKLMGIMALGDPVFNLRVRDEWIGWSVREREQRLVSVMDAYVVGAVPPYSHLLGGKVVAALLGSAEVARHFKWKYDHTIGGISGAEKRARLALVTVTSALGRSSIYNRLRLPGIVNLEPVGWTTGWGHFHVPDDVFMRMRSLLVLDDHGYANGHQYGDGPNWKLRVIREALGRMGMDGDALRHGISRQVYGMPLAANWRQYLRGISPDIVSPRPTAGVVSAAARERWIIPRAVRRPEFRGWTREQTLALFDQLIGS